VLWQVGKWCPRRRFQGARRKLAVAVLAGLLLAGAVVAQRQAQPH
jgi:hypothetical protein